MKYLKVILFSVMVLFVLSACSNKTYDNAIEKGLDSLEGKNYSKAISYFEIALEENKDSTEANSYLEQAVLLNEVNDFLTKEDFDQALNTIFKIEKLDDLLSIVTTQTNDFKVQITQKQQNLVYEDELESIRVLIENKEYDPAESKLETLKNLLADNSDYISKLEETSKILAEAKANNKGPEVNTKVEETSDSKQTEAFTYHTYTNTRFGFSVQYPTSFIEGPAPTNNDGREFSNEESTIVASGSHINIIEDNETIEKYYNQALENVSGSVAYQRVGNDWYVLSYKSGSNTVYQKAMINDDCIFTLIITYPGSQQEKYDEMVTQIADTFTPGHMD